MINAQDSNLKTAWLFARLGVATTVGDWPAPTGSKDKDALLAAMRTVRPEYAMLSSMAATLAHSDVVCCRPAPSRAAARQLLCRRLVL